MTIERLHSNNRMSQAVISGDTVYLSGQVADERDADITAQSQAVLKKIDDLLIETGSQREKMISATVILKSMSDFAAFNAVWDQWVVAGKPPARACIQAELAAPELLVEVCIIAQK